MVEGWWRDGGGRGDGALEKDPVMRRASAATRAFVVAPPIGGGVSSAAAGVGDTSEVLRVVALLVVSLFLGVVSVAIGRLSSQHLPP